MNFNNYALHPLRLWLRWMPRRRLIVEDKCPGTRSAEISPFGGACNEYVTAGQFIAGYDSCLQVTGQLYVRQSALSVTDAPLEY